jgi:hypothetical protein
MSEANFSQESYERELVFRLCERKKKRYDGTRRSKRRNKYKYRKKKKRNYESREACGVGMSVLRTRLNKICV